MLAIIGGTGLSEIEAFDHVGFKQIPTPFSDDPVNIHLYKFENKEIVFLSRHGEKGSIPPHRINYRANIWALNSIGALDVIAINVVGGINPKAGPGGFIIPDQLIDYSHNRASTFYEDDLSAVIHIDFSCPFSSKLRDKLATGFADANQSQNESDQRSLIRGGVYGCTQGPRLETSAEIVRMKNDGCDVVGMTAMPEASLAREIELNYAMLAFSVNWAAGLGDGEISMTQIRNTIKNGAQFLVSVLSCCAKNYD
ncbi:MAG: S-methyl-5'-thioinosine phosphorylase [Gammaproteobacteria bacterium]|nr:S-methyl-5'-thioinosine phosphorylase [Gammaproteobacteria bacterium]